MEEKSTKSPKQTKPTSFNLLREMAGVKNHKTASVYFLDNKMFVRAQELVDAYSEYGYCNHFKAEQILGKCHQENCIVDETYMVGSNFSCEKGTVMKLWKQDDGNQALPMFVWGRN